MGQYFVYRGQGGIIDYNNVVAVMDEGDALVAVHDQQLTEGQWQYVRKAVSADDTLSEPSPMVTVTIDAAGDANTPVGNAPVALQAKAVVGGKITLKWQYFETGQDAEPTGFRVYRSLDGSSWELQTSVAYLKRKRNYPWTSEALIHGQQYHWMVRTYKIDAEEPNTNVVIAQADSQGPPTITGVSAEIV